MSIKQKQTALVKKIISGKIGNPEVFIAANKQTIEDSLYKDSDMLRVAIEYNEGKLLPTQFIQKFGKALDSFLLLESYNAAKQKQQAREEKAALKEDKPPALISSKIMHEVLVKDPDTKESSYQWQIAEDDEGNQLAKDFSTYREAENWTNNKLHTGGTPRSKGIITDNRFDKPDIRTITFSSADYAKTRKLGHNTATKGKPNPDYSKGLGSGKMKEYPKAKNDHCSFSRG